MLDKKRVEEAKKNVERYLRDGILNKIEVINENILETYKRNSNESLMVAEHLFNSNLSSLWVIVSAYYSMYYIANAVLYSKQYKVGKEISHQVTNEALIIFIMNRLEMQLLEEYQQAKEEAEEIAKIESSNIIEDFEKEKSKRAFLQYETTDIIKRGKAETSLKRAKKFVFEMKKLLLN